MIKAMEMKNMNGQKTDDFHTGGNVEVEMKRPKRMLHFSDGIMEDFDDNDDVDPYPQIKPTMHVIESELQWGPWLFHKATKAGTTILSGCDYVGESLASALGITTPKYQSEIAEFKRIQTENANIQREKASWIQKENENYEVIVNEVTATTNGKHKF